MNTIENNKLIAEFMGMRQTSIYGCCRLENDPKGIFTYLGFECEGYTHLQYHSSWDWLMPVVEKIESVTTNVGFSMFCRKGCILQVDNNLKLVSNNKESKLMSVYDVVVQFINHYNFEKSLEFEVYSSHGILTCNKITGRVKAYEIFEGSEEEYLKNIVKVDIDEYLRYYNVMKMPSRVDILDLGTWEKDKSYTPAENDWREEMKLLNKI